MFSKLFGAAKLTKKGLERDDKFVITDIYTEWRNKFWALKPNELGIPPEAPDMVYQLIIDVGGSYAAGTKWVMSLFAQISGSISFIPSVGGGIVRIEEKNPGESENLISGTTQFLSSIKEASENGAPMNEAWVLPEPDTVSIYFFTKNDIKVINLKLEDIQSDVNPYNEFIRYFIAIKNLHDFYVKQ